MLFKISDLSDYEKTEGEVTYIGKSTHMTLKGSTIKDTYPVVRYEVNDVRYYHRGKNLIHINKYEQGEKVTLLYKKNLPDESSIYSISGYWFTVPNMMLCGMFCFFWIAVIEIKMMK